jgi:hypothetical protein
VTDCNKHMGKMELKYEMIQTNLMRTGKGEVMVSKLFKRFLNGLQKQ